MRALLPPFLAGLVFAIGLGVAGMTQPAKVIGFLDVTGRWDASLAFVMMGAIGVYLPVHRFIAARKTTLLGSSVSIPKGEGIDARLLLGAALFGIGWGIGGFCPGPAIVSAAVAAKPAVIFALSMLAGMALFRFVDRSRGKDTCG